MEMMVLNILSVAQTGPITIVHQPSMIMILMYVVFPNATEGFQNFKEVEETIEEKYDEFKDYLLSSLTSHPSSKLCPVD